MNMTKRKITLDVSPNLYDLYKDKYNFSKILDEILTDFLIVGEMTKLGYKPTDSIISFKTKDKIYKINERDYINFINRLIDICRTNT